MNIFLIGFMGVGKSTIGKKLATHFNYSFVDSDDAIEQISKKSIEEIFEEQGEAYFRNLEYQWLNNLNVNNTIIATGGGMPCFNTTFDLISTKGISIYLKASPAFIASRLKNSKKTRPILSDVMQNNDLLIERITALLNSRESVYQKCDVIIDIEPFNTNYFQQMIDLINEARK